MKRYYIRPWSAKETNDFSEAEFNDTGEFNKPEGGEFEVGQFTTNPNKVIIDIFVKPVISSYSGVASRDANNRVDFSIEGPELPEGWSVGAYLGSNPKGDTRFVVQYDVNQQYKSDNAFTNQTYFFIYLLHQGSVMEFSQEVALPTIVVEEPEEPVEEIVQPPVYSGYTFPGDTTSLNLIETDGPYVIDLREVFNGDEPDSYSVNIARGWNEVDKTNHTLTIFPSSASGLNRQPFNIVAYNESGEDNFSFRITVSPVSEWDIEGTIIKSSPEAPKAPVTDGTIIE